MLEKLFCKHNKLELIQEGDWHILGPTPATLNEFIGVEQRILTYKCEDCKKQFETVETDI